jgi:hypothetical protein
MKLAEIFGIVGVALLIMALIVKSDERFREFRRARRQEELEYESYEEPSYDDDRILELHHQPALSAERMPDETVILRRPPTAEEVMQAGLGRLAQYKELTDTTMHGDYYDADEDEYPDQISQDMRAWNESVPQHSVTAEAARAQAALAAGNQRAAVHARGHLLHLPPRIPLRNNLDVEIYTLSLIQHAEEFRDKLKAFAAA